MHEACHEQLHATHLPPPSPSSFFFLPSWVLLSSYFSIHKAGGWWPHSSGHCLACIHNSFLPLFFYDSMTGILESEEVRKNLERGSGPWPMVAPPLHTIKPHPPLAFHKLRILIKLPLNIISYWVGRFYFLIRFYCINIRII